MRFIKSVIMASAFIAQSAMAQAEPPRFATKLGIEGLRFISRDGRFSYVHKRSGGLSLVNDFKTINLMDGVAGTNYLVNSSMFHKRVLIEVEQASHQELDLNKLHAIWVAPIGSTTLVSVGKGRAPRLHLNDDWVTWTDPKSQSVHAQFLPVANRHFAIRLGQKHNPFFLSEVVMVDPENIMYTDVNNKGFAALLSFNIATNKVTVVYKAAMPGTRLEICAGENFAALGEFPYPGALRGSSISVMAWKAVPGLSGFTRIYDTTDGDVGQMICEGKKVYFVKAMQEDREFNLKRTEAAVIDIITKKIDVLTSLQHVSNLVNMDGRILLPFREDIFVLSGSAGSTRDQLVRPQVNTP